MRLRTSDPRRPGFSRVRHGRGFAYRDTSGAPLRDPDQLARVRSLVIPPAWRDVWICPWPNGHLQAVGTDDAGRRQYLYHPEFRARQERAKHEHVQEMAAALPDVRARVAEDLQGRGLSHDRVTACAVRLLDLGFFRIGSERYTRDHHTYGLTTMERDHVSCGRGTMTFSYPAKGGKHVVRGIVDAPAETVVRALLRRPPGGARLFAYWQSRAWRDLTAEDLNDALRRFSGTEVTAKDFRTWHATVLAAVALAVTTDEAHDDRDGTRRTEARAVREVSRYLGNTPAVCRASYIDPRVFERFEEGATIAPVLDRLGEHGTFGRPATQGAVERAVLELLSA
jgi:DNA topoisomerase IB